MRVCVRFESRKVTRLLSHVGSLPLGVRAKGQRLQAVNRAPLCDAQHAARALEPRLVVVEVRMNPWRCVVRDAAALARDGGVVRVADGHVVARGARVRPLVHLLAAHEQLAVVAPVGRDGRGADADARRGADVEARTCVCFRV